MFAGRVDDAHAGYLEESTIRDAKSPDHIFRRTEELMKLAEGSLSRQETIARRML